MISQTSLSNSLLLSALLSTLLSTVSATPRGAPKCGINGTAIQAGMGTPSDPSLGYFLDVKPAGNNNWNITIQNRAGRSDYQGILMYVHQINTPKVHLGMFTFKNQTKWKFQPLSVCDAGGITSTTPMSTFTHALPDKVPLSKNVTFVWTSNAKELNMNALVVHAAIASLDPGKAGKARWQEVQFVGIPPTPNSGAPDTLPNSPGGGTSPAGGSSPSGGSSTSDPSASVSASATASDAAQATGYLPPTDSTSPAGTNTGVPAASAAFSYRSAASSFLFQALATTVIFVLM